MRCTIFDNGSWKIEPVACLFKKKNLRIPINKSIKVGNTEFKCKMKKNENNSTRLSTFTRCNGKSIGKYFFCINFLN